jgi:hypothetical protein
MKALTLQQPYATSVAIGPKRIENRPRPTVPRPLPPGGLWIALHAGKGWYPGGIKAVREVWPECPDPREMPLGALLGVMRIDRVEMYSRHTFSSDLWAFGPWCLTIGEVRRLDQPIPCRGLLGCWPVPAEHVAALLALVPSTSATRSEVGASESRPDDHPEEGSASPGASGAGEQGCCADRKYGKGCTPETCMNLPKGVKCSFCVHWSRCNGIGYSTGPDSRVCFFFPRRFHLDPTLELPF